MCWQVGAGSLVWGTHERTTYMKKLLVRLPLLSIPLLCAVQCDNPPQMESEPNDTFDEAFSNPQNPVINPALPLVFGELYPEDPDGLFPLDVDLFSLHPATNGAMLRQLRTDSLIETPLKRTKTPHRFADLSVTKLEFDERSFAEIKRQSENAKGFDIGHFPLPDSTDVTLKVQATEPLADEATCVIASYVDGMYEEVQIARPDVVTLQGSIVGEDESLVFLALTPNGSTGFIRRGEQTLILSTENKPDGEVTPIIFDLAEIPGDFFPVGDRVAQAFSEDQFPPQPPGGGGLAGSDFDPPRRRLDIAIDTTNDFCDYFDDNTDAAYTYILALVAAGSSIFEDAINLELKLSYLRLWTTDSDPWADDVDALSFSLAFAQYWFNEMAHVERDLLFLFTGEEPLDVGSWRSNTGVCEFNWAALQQWGTVSFPVVDMKPWNWDLINFCSITALQIGAIPDEDYCPPITQCASPEYFGECQTEWICTDGTLTSSCYYCDGSGASRIQLVFHEQAQAAMLEYLDAVSSECDYTVQPPMPVDATLMLAPGGVAFSSLARVIEDPLTGERSYEFLWDESFDNTEGTELEAFPFSVELEPEEKYIIYLLGTTDLYILLFLFEDDQ